MKQSYKSRLLLKRLGLPLVLLLVRIGWFSRFVPLLNWCMRVTGVKRIYNTKPDGELFADLFEGELSPPATSRGSALFLMMHATTDMHVVRSLLLSRKLQSLGYRAELLVCRSAIEICPRDSVYRNRGTMPFFCYECYGGYDYISRTTGIATSYLRASERSPQGSLALRDIDQLDSVSSCRQYRFAGFALGKMAEKSVMYFLTRDDLIDDGLTRSTYQKYLKAGVNFVESFSEALDRSGPIRWLILGNGSLLFDRLAAEIARSRGIEFVTQEFYDGTTSWVYEKNGIAVDMTFPEKWREFKDQPFSDEARTKVTTFMEGKQAGAGLVVPMNDPKMRGRHGSITPGSRPVACIFTNFAWDTTVLGRNRLFSSTREWLRETIAFWKSSGIGGTLLIRAHPAEAKLRAPSTAYVRDMVSDLVDGRQVVLIDSTSPVNSYDLVDAMDFGIVYGSTIGLEIAYAGKPCIVAGAPHYLDQPFAITPKSTADYFDRIRALAANPRQFVPDRETLLRYLSFVYFDRVKQLTGIENDYLNARSVIQVQSGDDWLSTNSEVLAEFCAEIGA